MNEEQNDRLEQLIGLTMDGRLGAAETRELDQLLESDPAAREVERSMLTIRATLRQESPPTVPAGLRDRVVSRVSAAMTRQSEDARILPMVRRLAAAAAILLCATLFVWVGGLDDVKADPKSPEKVRAIEDEIRDRQGDDDSLHEFLAWHYLRRQP